MGKVRLKIPSWVASMLTQNSHWLILEKETEEWATIGDLLADFALSYPDFHKVVFNPDIGKVSEQVTVILNDSLLQCPDMTEVRLNDGDSVTLFPVFSGG